MALTLLLLGLLVTVVGLVLEVISLRATLGSLDRESVGEVKGSVRRLETNMHNSTRDYLVKLNSLYKRVAALEVEMSISSGNKQMLVASEVFFTSSALSLLLLNWSQLTSIFRLLLVGSLWNWPYSCSSSQPFVG